MFSLYFISIRSRKKFNRKGKVSRIEFIKNIRENWNEVKIDVDNCLVINFDTKIDANSPTYSMTNENETFYDWMSRDTNRTELVDVSRSKIICKYEEKGKLTIDFSAIVDMDITVVEFKLRMQDYISVYFPEELNNEDYYIDLEFLNKDIDLIKFK